MAVNISVGKCNVLHIGRNNPEFKYFLDGKALTPSNCVKDLGVFTSNTMSSTFHCNELYKKASRICALIRKTFISRNVDLMLQAFRVYVLPILDYCSQVYSPHKLSDIRLLERIQRKFTKRILQGNLSYNERLRHFGLESLEMRRLKNDILLAYKIIHNQIPVLSHLFQSRNQSKTTRTTETFNLVIPKFKVDSKKYFFVNRVSKVLNSFPVNRTLMDRYNLKLFKQHLNATDLKRFIRGATS